MADFYLGCFADFGKCIPSFIQYGKYGLLRFYKHHTVVLAKGGWYVLKNPTELDVEDSEVGCWGFYSQTQKTLSSGEIAFVTQKDASSDDADLFLKDRLVTALGNPNNQNFVAEQTYPYFELANPFYDFLDRDFISCSFIGSFDYAETAAMKKFLSKKIGNKPTKENYIGIDFNDDGVFFCLPDANIPKPNENISLGNKGSVPKISNRLFCLNSEILPRWSSTYNYYFLQLDEGSDDVVMMCASKLAPYQIYVTYPFPSTPTLETYISPIIGEVDEATMAFMKSFKGK